MMLRGERTGYVLYAISPVDGSMREVIRNQRGIGRPLWLPDSQSVLVAINDSTGRGQLWDVSIRRGDKQRVTNDLANWGTVIDVARDAHRVTAVQWTLSANIWEATGSNPTDAHQITFGEVPIVASLPLKRTTFVVSADGQLWTLNGKSRQRLPFSTLRDVGPPVQCGRFVVVPSYQTGSDSPADAASVTATQLGSGRVAVLRSYQSGPARIMRLDSDGLNATMLASGLVFSPTCSPDGRDLFYVSMPTPQKIMRVPVEGGTAHVVGNIPGATVRGSMKASPDGKFLAFPYDVYGSTPGLKLGIVSVNQGQLVKSFDAPMGIYRESCLRWAPDGKSLQYLLTTGDVTNIWEQPLSGGSAHQFTQFASGRMFDFNWSTDGKTILMSRGEVSGDVVLLTKSF
jgi:Tol biopolymer transport system component